MKDKWITRTHWMEDEALVVLTSFSLSHSNLFVVAYLHIKLRATVHFWSDITWWRMVQNLPFSLCMMCSTQNDVWHRESREFWKSWIQWWTNKSVVNYYNLRMKYDINSTGAFLSVLVKVVGENHRSVSIWIGLPSRKIVKSKNFPE